MWALNSLESICFGLFVEPLRGPLNEDWSNYRMEALATLTIETTAGSRRVLLGVYCYLTGEGVGVGAACRYFGGRRCPSGTIGQLAFEAAAPGTCRP